jgi:hypothetical protein
MFEPRRFCFCFRFVSTVPRGTAKLIYSVPPYALAMPINTIVVRATQETGRSSPKKRSAGRERERLLMLVTVYRTGTRT